MRTKLYNWILENVDGNHLPLNQIPSVTTYARELGLYTALYIPFELVTDEAVFNHIQESTTIRPPYFRNSEGKISKNLNSVEDVLLQNRQHIEFLNELPDNTEKTFIIDGGFLVETKPNSDTDLIGKKGLIAKNHLTRTVTYSGHAVAIPDNTLHHPTMATNVVIGLPRAVFKKLGLSISEPIMFLRNPVIKSGGVHFAYPIPTKNSHAVSVHPYFCDETNLDFDGDQIQFYRIMHPENIRLAKELIKSRYPQYLPEPTNKDFALFNKIDGLSLQDYVNNSDHFKEFVKLRPSKKVTNELHLSAVDLLKERTEQEWSEHLKTSSAYIGLFQAKADIGKTGGLYKKLIYAFPNDIKKIMEIVEPLSQATLDQKHTKANFSVDRIVNAFNELQEPSNLAYVLANTKPEHHDFIEKMHDALNVTPLALRHLKNMPLLTYLGTKFTQKFPKSFYTQKENNNLFGFLTSLGNPTPIRLEMQKPVLELITVEEATKMYENYVEKLANKSEMIPQKVYENGQIVEHRFNKTLVDKTNVFSEYLTSQMVAVSKDDKDLYTLPPVGFCPYQRTEKDPESPDPITFIPYLTNHLTSATPLNIPYLHNTEHARLVYACNNIKQALQLANAEEPLCRTKYHKTLKIGVNLLATFLSHPDVYEDAVVISETASKKLMTIEGNLAKPGDKITGRHGNKAVISRVVPDNLMPFDERTNQFTEIIFSPMSVTSRKNFGFLAEIQSNILNENQAHIETNVKTLLQENDPKLNETLTGMCYILRNNHIAEHGTRAVANVTSFTQFKQPAKGENFSLNHAYALEVLGMRPLIAEFFSFRSNQDQIENKTMVLNQEPQSIQVLRSVYLNLVK